MEAGLLVIGTRTRIRESGMTCFRNCRNTIMIMDIPMHAAKMRDCTNGCPSNGKDTRMEN